MSFASIIFRMVTPAFKAGIDTVTEWVSYLKKHEVAVQAFFTILSAVITTMVIPTLARLGKALWRNPITWVIAAIALLSIAIEDFYGWANGKQSAFQEVWEAIFPGPEGREEALTFIEDVKTAFIDLGKTLKDIKERGLGTVIAEWLTGWQQEDNKAHPDKENMG